MVNFKKICTLDANELHGIIDEILDTRVIWKEIVVGTHKGHSRIFLNKILPVNDKLKINLSHQTNPFIFKGPQYYNFPKLINFIETFSKNKGEIGRIILFKINPNGNFKDHIESGSYYKKRNRYHLVVVSGEAALKCGEESCTMYTGEVWWFNNKLRHSLENKDGSKPRIYVAFDILPNGSESFFTKSIRKILNRILIISVKN